MVQISRSLLFRGFLAIFFLFLQANSSRSEEEMENDDFDDELYSVIHSVRDGSLWSNSRKIRSIDVNRTIDHETFTDNSLWNDLWHECRRKASFSCIRTGVFKYLDKSLDRPGNFSLTDSLFFRSNKNKVNGFCENSDEGKEKCLRYNMEKSKVVGADDAEPEKKKVQEKSEDRKNVTVNENHGKIDFIFFFLAKGAATPSFCGGGEGKY